MFSYLVNVYNLQRIWKPDQGRQRGRANKRHHARRLVQSGSHLPSGHWRDFALTVCCHISFFGTAHQIAVCTICFHCSLSSLPLSSRLQVKRLWAAIFYGKKATKHLSQKAIKPTKSYSSYSVHYKAIHHTYSQIPCCSYLWRVSAFMIWFV